MTKPKKYLAKLTDRVWNTKEEAIRDNATYKKDVNYRYRIKSENYKSPLKNYNIPFIPEKKITLTNAGLATGAVLSTNLLDSIAVNAERAGLPIKTAIGLATKESTLNNPTSSVLNRAKISVNDRDVVATSKINGYSILKAHQQKGNRNVLESDLINFTSDDNPYLSTMLYLNPPFRSGRRSKITTQEEFDRKLKESELYNDRRATINQAQPSKSYLQAGFELYKRNPQRYNPGQSNYQQLVDKRANEVWGSPEIQEWNRRRLENAGKRDKESYGGSIHIAPSKRGTFTAAATKHGMGVQEFASKVLRNKEDYSPSLVKKANFARNASKWNH